MMHSGKSLAPALALLLALLLALTSCDAAPRATGPGGEPAVDPATRIGPGLADALARDGAARVMIALVPPVAIPDAGMDVARLRRDVADRVDGFLGRVATGDLVVARRYEGVAALAATIPDEAALSRLAADPAVRRIDLDVGGTGGLESSVPRIGADARHAAGNDGAGVTMALLDTGVDTDHPSLAGRITHQACFGQPESGSGGFCPDGGNRETGDGAAEDDAGHGTHVGGILASDGAVGAPGVAPGAELVVVKVLDTCSFSGCFYAFSEIVAALDYLITNQETLGVRVINMSLGTAALFPGTCDESTAFNMAGAQAVNTLRGMGVLTVASAMNNGSATSMASPACLANVVAVGSVTLDDVVASSSNANAATDLVAPGVGIASLARGGGTTVASGTSMAAPHVAGCAALLLQAGSLLTVDDVRTRLRTSPITVTDPKNGRTYPRLDCTPDLRPPGPRETVTIGRPDDG